MTNTSFQPQEGEDQFVSLAQTAALQAQEAQASAEAAQALAETALANINTSLAGFLPLGGGTLTGALTLSDAEINPLDAATREFVTNTVDAAVTSVMASLSDFLPLTGGTLTDALTLSGNEDGPLDAATRAFVTQSFAEAAPYDLGIFFNGIPGADEDLFRFVAVRDFVIFADPTSAVAVAQVAPTAAYTISLQLNEVEVGTIDFTAGSLTGALTLTTDASFTVGDTLDLVGRTVPDTTIEDIQITITGNV